MYFFDATPLIYLATIDRLELLEDLHEPCVMPDPVYDEVVTRGLDAVYPDPRRLERAIDEDRIAVVTAPESALFDRLQQNDNLSRADAAVLAVADDRDGTAIMDEQYGRDVADTESVTTRGTAFLVLWLLREEHLTSTEAIEIIDPAEDR